MCICETKKGGISWLMEGGTFNATFKKSRGAEGRLFKEKKSPLRNKNIVNLLLLPTRGKGFTFFNLMGKFGKYAVCGSSGDGSIYYPYVKEETMKVPKSSRVKEA